MADPTPVFSDRIDSKVWSKLADIEKNLVSKNVKKNSRKLTQLINDICNREQCVDSHILCKSMSLAGAYGLENLSTVIINIISKCDLADCTSQLKAAGMLIDMGSVQEAKLVLDRITIVSNVSLWEYERGRINLADGNVENAKKHFLRSHDINHRFLPVYSELDKIDPSYGWVFLKNIMLIRNEMPSRPYGNDLPSCSMEELYGIYWEWESGNRDGAETFLKKSTEFVAGNKEFILAAARMARDMGNNLESIEKYKLITGDPEKSFSISLELARVYVKADMADKAVALCKTLEKICSADRRLTETMMEAHAALENRAELKKYVDMYLYHEYADLDAYVLSIKLLSSLSMHPEASMLISKVSASCPDADVVPLLSSMNDFEAQRYAAALSSANKAVRRAPNEPMCKCQRAKILLTMGNTKKALRDVNDVLEKDKNNNEALLMKKQILESMGEFLGAYEICKIILAFDSRNTDILRDSADLLEKLGREDDAIKAYREALDVREDFSLFVKVLTFLVESGKYEIAVQIATEYDDIYGSHAEPWIFKGNSEFALGRFMNASESFLKATEIEYNNPTIWHSKGMADEYIGNYDEAETAYDKAVLMDLDNPEYWISKASVQEKKGDFGSAITSLNRVISDHPDSTFALMRKASILIRLGRYGEATFFIDLALRIDPMNVSISKIKRDLFIHLGEYQKVISVCNSILLVEPTDMKTMMDLSDAYSAMSRYDDSLSVLYRMQEIDSDSISVMKAIRTIQNAKGDTDEEVRICRAILMKDENDAETKMALADASMRQGNAVYAEKLYDELRETSPQDPTLSIKKAKLTAEMGDDDKARNILEESLANDPHDTDTLVELADLSALSGNTAGAIDYIDRAIAVNASSPALHLKKARIQIDGGMYSDAQTTLDIVLHLSTNPNPQIWAYLGETQEKLGDNSHALISYDSAMKMGIDTPDMYRNRGRVQEALGLRDAAMNSYSIASLRDGKDAFSLERIASMQMDDGRESVAARYLDKAIEANPIYWPAIIARAKIYASHDDDNGLRMMVDRCTANGISGEKITEITDMLSDKGVIVTDAEEMPVPVPNVPVDEISQKVESKDDSIDGYARELLRQAYETGFVLDDEALINKSGIPQEKVGEVLSFLSDIKVCDIIVPGTPEFERMEVLSHNVVTKEAISDIESDPIIPLPSAFFSSGAKSITEAKELIAYIYRAMTMDLDPAEFNDEIAKTVNDVSNNAGDITVFSIMKSYSMGVFSARTVKMLSIRNSESVVDHI